MNDSNLLPKRQYEIDVKSPNQLVPTCVNVDVTAMCDNKCQMS